MKKPMTYEELRQETLSDFESAMHYLRFALQENDSKHFMAAFANVVEAQGGAGKFSERTHLSRQTIYNAMKNKSLRVDSLFDILQGLGLQIDLVPLVPPAKKGRKFTLEPYDPKNGSKTDAADIAKMSSLVRRGKAKARMVGWMKVKLPKRTNPKKVTAAK